MPSKIDADPLLAALFDIPADVQVQTSPSKPNHVRGRHHRTIATGTTPSSKRLRPPDDTGLRHGERVFPTEEEYSDAVAVTHDHDGQRISTLQSKMKWIRSTIRALEGDLMTTRNALAHANRHLQSATMEIADIQRAALDTDAELSQFMQRHAGRPASPATSASQPSPLNVYDEGGRELCPSLRSRSSSTSLNYFTPTSSIVDSEEESDCYTPRSATSCDSSWLNEKDRSHMPDEKKPDLDTTPLRRNYNSEGKRRFKFGPKGKVSHTLTKTDSCKEENSSDTPSTIGSTKEEESIGGSRERQRRKHLLSGEVAG